MYSFLLLSGSVPAPGLGPSADWVATGSMSAPGLGPFAYWVETGSMPSPGLGPSADWIETGSVPSPGLGPKRARFNPEDRSGKESRGSMSVLLDDIF